MDRSPREPYLAGTMALPLPIVVLLLVVQVGALVMGFTGPPGSRVRPALTILLLGTGLVLLPLGLGAVAIGEPRTGTLMVWIGVLLFACAARLLRAPEHRPDDEDDEGGGGGPGGPQPPPDAPGGPGLDWDAFDREREGWGRPRTPAGTH
jgi:hypothetical protein